MNSDSRDDAARSHWREVYRQRPAQDVSWYRAHLDTSLALLAAGGLDARSRVLDVGGGASTLVDDLLARGVGSIHVLDLATEALDTARARLGERAARVEWLTGDVTRIALPAGGYTHWHDRAVLHFLVDRDAASAYAEQAAHAIASGGCAVIGGFAPDGPSRCSGLDVARRSAEDIAALLGPRFELVEARDDVHHTPGGSPQAFAWALLKRA